MTSGARSRRTRAKRKAAAKSTSWAGASRMRSWPSLARRASSPSGCATSTVRWPRARRPSDRQEDLVLSPAPGASGVDVEENMSEAQKSEDRRQKPERSAQRRSAHSVFCLLSSGFCSSLPQFHELQHHVVRVQHRDDEAGRAVPECRRAGGSSAGTPRRRAARSASGPVAPAVLEHLPRRQARVPVDRAQVVRHVAVRVVLQVRPQPAGSPSACDRLVDVPPGPLRAAPVVEPQLVVGVPVGRSNPAARGNG